VPITRLIGDIHGEYSLYLPLIRDCPQSIQVGDFGMGFDYTGEADFVDNMLHAVSGEHRFIRGNHDSPAMCRATYSCIDDGTVTNGTMFIGGALSVDRAMRKPNFNWWHDEELSEEELEEELEDYKYMNPRVMITHDCPNSVTNYLCEKENLLKRNDPSRTRATFERMFYHHQPELWVFGHWHTSFDMVLDGTRFICLDILETIDLEL